MSDNVEVPAWMEDPQAALPAQQKQAALIPPRLKRSVGASLERIWKERKHVLTGWTPPVRARVRLGNLALYVRQLGLMLNAGVALVKAFEILGTQGEDTLLMKTSLLIREEVLQGRSISAAFSRYPKVFPPFLVFTVQSAEVSGTLPASLLRLADYFDKQNRQQQKIRASLVYPAFVFTFALFSFVAIVGYIFPLFSQFFEGLNFQLPPITRFLFWLFDLFTSKWLWIFAAVLCGFSYPVWRLISSKPGTALRLNILQLQLPLVGPLLLKIVASHFCRSLSTMIGSGVYILAALEVLQKGATMPVFKVLLYDLQEELRTGEPLASALKDLALFPRVVEDLVAIGEESGNLQTMLQKGSDYLDIEIDTLLQNLTALIEPLLIIVLGIMVGTILIGLFLPLYTAIGQIH